MSSLMKMLPGLVLAVAAGIAQAQTPTPSNTLGPFVQYSLTGSSASGSVTTVFGGDWVHASGPAGPSGTATVDGLGTIGAASIGVSGAGTFNDSWAWSGWNDQIRVTTGTPGQTVRIWFWVAYDWSASVTGDGNGYAYIDVALRRPTAGAAVQYASIGETITRSCSHAGACGEMTVNNSGSGSASTYGEGQALFSFEIEAWRDYTMVVGMNAGVTGNDATASVSAPSLRWGSLFLVNNAGPYVVSSLSGFDYTNPAPIPEAPTPALWGIGLAALVLGRRVRR